MQVPSGVRKKYCCSAEPSGRESVSNYAYLDDRTSDGLTVPCTHIVHVTWLHSHVLWLPADPPEEHGEDDEVYPQGTAVLLAATPPSCGPVVWPKPPTWTPPQPPASHLSVDTTTGESSSKSQAGL